MLDHKSTFYGTFQEGGIKDVIPPTVLQFMGMIEHGADIKSQLRFRASKSDLAMAQLLQYNCYARYKEGAATHRHSREQETLFPLYMGMSVFAKTRKRQLVEMLHGHGISIPYDRVLEVSVQLVDAAVAKYVEDGVVCPQGLFTTAVMDNIDNNPTATTAASSFHGTSISMFQQPTTDNEGEKREPLQLGDKKTKTVRELPDSYTNIRPAFFRKKNPFPIRAEGLIVPGIDLLKTQPALEYEWMEKSCVTE